MVVVVVLLVCWARACSLGWKSRGGTWRRLRTRTTPPFGDWLLMGRCRTMKRSPRGRLRVCNEVLMDGAMKSWSTVDWSNVRPSIGLRWMSREPPLFEPFHVQLSSIFTNSHSIRSIATTHKTHPQAALREQHQQRQVLFLLPERCRASSRRRRSCRRPQNARNR